MRKREATRFVKVFEALTSLDMRAELAPYQDESCDDVRRQLLKVDGVLVWVNPIEDGRDRSVLDAMLREVAASGVFVSAHPDVILKLGTKEVLYRTRDIGWGCDTHLYRSMADLRRELPLRLAAGDVRVLKQYRGNGGDGVWKVRLAVTQVAADAGTRLRPDIRSSRSSSARQAWMRRRRDAAERIYRALRAVFFRRRQDDRSSLPTAIAGRHDPLLSRA